MRKLRFIVGEFLVEIGTAFQRAGYFTLPSRPTVTVHLHGDTSDLDTHIRSIIKDTQRSDARIGRMN